MYLQEQISENKNVEIILIFSWFFRMDFCVHGYVNIWYNFIMFQN